MFSGYGTRAQEFDWSHDSPLSIVVFGDPQVGKTSLFEEYCGTKGADETIEQTSGMDIHAKRVRMGRGTIGAYFYDFSGDIDSRPALDVYLRAIIKKSQVKGEGFPFSAVFLVFDCRTKSSLIPLQSWLDWFNNRSISIYQNLCSLNTKEFEAKLAELPVVVFGNKIDHYKAEPFFNHEFSSLPRDQRETVQHVVEQSNIELRNRMGMGDCDNLVFVSSSCPRSKIDEVMNRVVQAINDKGTASISHENFSLLSQTLAKCRKGRFFDSDNTNSIFSKLLSFFRKKEVALPL
jgi:GTPase SAR1 family protein